jgi:hypothetical protein
MYFDIPPPPYVLVQAPLCTGNAVNVSQYAPPTAVELKLHVIIRPSDGRILILTPASAGQPMRIYGPEATVTIPISGPTICVQGVPGDGPIDYQLEAAGFTDDVNVK